MTCGRSSTASRRCVWDASGEGPASFGSPVATLSSLALVSHCRVSVSHVVSERSQVGNPSHRATQAATAIDFAKYRKAITTPGVVEVFEEAAKGAAGDAFGGRPTRLLTRTQPFDVGIDFPEYSGPEAAALEAKFASLVRADRTLMFDMRLAALRPLSGGTQLMTHASVTFRVTSCDLFSFRHPLSPRTSAGGCRRGCREDVYCPYRCAEAGARSCSRREGEFTFVGLSESASLCVLCWIASASL